MLSYYTIIDRSLITKRISSLSYSHASCISYISITNSYFPSNSLTKLVCQPYLNYVILSNNILPSHLMFSSHYHDEEEGPATHPLSHYLKPVSNLLVH